MTPEEFDDVYTLLQSGTADVPLFHAGGYGIAHDQENVGPLFSTMVEKRVGLYLEPPANNVTFVYVDGELAELKDEVPPALR